VPHQTKNNLAAVTTACEKRASPAKEFGISKIGSFKFFIQQVLGVLFLVTLSEGGVDYVSDQRLFNALGS
jgi:hypothetical protein